MNKETPESPQKKNTAKVNNFGEVKEESRPLITEAQSAKPVPIIDEPVISEKKPQEAKKVDFISIIVAPFKFVFKTLWAIVYFVGCRGLACLGCLGCFGIIAFIIFMFLSKPASLWGNFVNFLNAEANVPQAVVLSANDVKENIAGQIKNRGDNFVVITENQLTSLARDKFVPLNNPTFDIEENKIVLYWEIDSTDPATPLLGVIELNLDNKGVMSIAKIGTPRIALPAFLYQAVNNVALSFLSFGSGQTDSSAFLSSVLFQNNQNLSIKDIQVLKDEIRLVVSLDVNI